MNNFFLKKSTKRNGFTLIEVLTSVVILGILSGLTMSIINTGRKVSDARDAVVRANMDKYVQAIDSYCKGENYCPTKSDITNTTGTFRKVYVTGWDSNFVYNNNGTGVDGIKATEFELYARLNKSLPNGGAVTSESWNNPSCGNWLCVLFHIGCPSNCQKITTTTYKSAYLKYNSAWSTLTTPWDGPLQECTDFASGMSTWGSCK